MLLLPEAAGPMDPAGSTPDRRPGSIRRTSKIDTARPDGLRGDLVVTARARDLRTGPDGNAEVVAEAELVARVARATQQLLSVETSPALPALQQLVGAVAGPGFRGRLALAVPGGRRRVHSSACWPTTCRVRCSSPATRCSGRSARPDQPSRPRPRSAALPAPRRPGRRRRRHTGGRRSRCRRATTPP